jgi:hypothetical protein
MGSEYRDDVWPLKSRDSYTVDGMPVIDDAASRACR